MKRLYYILKEVRAKTNFDLECVFGDADKAVTNSDCSDIENIKPESTIEIDFVGSNGNVWTIRAKLMDVNFVKNE